MNYSDIFLDGELYWLYITNPKKADPEIRKKYNLRADQTYQVGRYPEKEAGRLTIDP